MHVAIALAARGAKIACIDLDSRQRHTLPLSRKTAAIRWRGAVLELAMPDFEVFEHDSLAPAGTARG